MADRSKKQISQPKLLIGEGIDELRLFTALLQHLQISDVQVEEYEGKGKVDKYLKTLRKRPNFDHLKSLGITRDADTSAQKAFESVCGSLNAHRYAQPKQMAVTVQGSPSISVFILPDCVSPGMLEDVCLASLHNEPDFQCIDPYLNCVRQKANRQPKNLAKARIHAWLASQVEPGKRLAEAAEAGYLDWNNSAFEELIAFLQQL